jgi:hypothetical protein
VSEEVRLQEIIAQKEAENRLLRAENERQSQDIKLLKEKIDSVWLLDKFSILLSNSSRLRFGVELMAPTSRR